MVSTRADGASVEARSSLSAATSSACSAARSVSSSSTRRRCSPVSRSSTKPASSSHASTGVRRCGSSRLRAGGTGWSALISSIRLSCRSRRPCAAAYASCSRSNSCRNPSGVPAASGSASTSTRASPTRTPGAPRTRARSVSGSSERGSPVTRTRPSGGTLPRARRRQSAPCAYTTTESSVDSHLCTDSAVMSSAPCCVHAERSLRAGSAPPPRIGRRAGRNALWPTAPSGATDAVPQHPVVTGAEGRRRLRCRDTVGPGRVVTADAHAPPPGRTSGHHPAFPPRDLPRTHPRDTRPAPRPGRTACPARRLPRLRRPGTPGGPRPGRRRGPYPLATAPPRAVRQGETAPAQRRRTAAVAGRPRRGATMPDSSVDPTVEGWR